MRARIAMFAAPLGGLLGVAAVACDEGGTSSQQSSDVSPVNGVYSVETQTSTPSSLPKCTSALAGTVAYVSSPSSLWRCESGGWNEIMCTAAQAGKVAYDSATETLWACAEKQWSQVALPHGPQGDAGPPGPTGAQGPQGLQGNQGDAGANALIIVQPPFAADAGTPAQNAACPAGGTEIDTGTDNGTGAFAGSPTPAYVCTGAPGEAGAPGPTGPEGPAGDAGPQGEQGPQGPPGTLAALRCNGLQPQINTTNGWLDFGAPCSGSTPFCFWGECTSVYVPPSCQAGGPGMTNCGAAGENCCTSPEASGGTYYRTYSNSGSGPTGEADPATVSSFSLDKYLVTVGRFRQFVSAWNGGAGWTPPQGSGKHGDLNGGQGLVDVGAPPAAGTVYETGWLTSDNSYIAPTDGNLACASNFDTWTPAPGNDENLPIICMNWYEAYAFCIWDGGFLPNEAEWEYAAAGGNQQREYPWGSTDPGNANQYAIYDCNYPSGPVTCPESSSAANIAPVGTASLGAGLWGQLDLAGDMWEWNLDWEKTYVPCTDCGNLTAPPPSYPPSSHRVIRGENYIDLLLTPTPAERNGWTPSDRYAGIGFRCARPLACTPGATQCSPPAGVEYVQTCNAQGQWEYAACSPGWSCVNAACVSPN